MNARRPREATTGAPRPMAAMAPIDHQRERHLADVQRRNANVGEPATEERVSGEEHREDTEARADDPTPEHGEDREPNRDPGRERHREQRRDADATPIATPIAAAPTNGRATRGLGAGRAARR